MGAGEHDKEEGGAEAGLTAGIGTTRQEVRRSTREHGRMPPREKEVDWICVVRRMLPFAGKTWTAMRHVACQGRGRLSRDV